jgi:F-type H+-transporting ATPase subunit b
MQNMHRTRLLCALTLVLVAVALVSPVFANDAEGAAAESWAPTIAKIINFSVLAAAVWYFGRSPIADYLSGRAAGIKKDLVDAKTLRATAEQQLAGVKDRLAKLPGELAALKTQGEQELAAEKVRLAEATVTERQRLIEQTRREIDLQSRLARRALVEHGVDLSMSLAKARIEKNMTAEDQARLVDRYAAGVRS